MPLLSVCRGLICAKKEAAVVKGFAEITVLLLSSDFTLLRGRSAIELLYCLLLFRKHIIII